MRVLPAGLFVCVLALTFLSGCSSDSAAPAQVATPHRADDAHSLRRVDGPFEHVYHFQAGPEGHINGSLRWTDSSNKLQVSAKLDERVNGAVCGSGGGWPSTLSSFNCNDAPSAWVTVTVKSTELAAAETYTLDVKAR